MCFKALLLTTTLRRRHRRRLDVVAVEVALEVEVSQRLTFRDGEELAQRSIRLDVVLVLELVGLYILVDGLGDLRAAHESSGRATEESEELGGDLSRALEDGRSTLDLYTILINLHAAAALASILHLAVNTLLQLLDLGEESGGSLTERVQVARNSLEVVIESGDRGYSDRRRLYRGRGYYYRGRYSYRLSNSDGLRGSSLGGALGLGRGSYSGGHGGRGGYNRGGISRGALLRDTLRGRSGSRHYTGR